MAPPSRYNSNRETLALCWYVQEPLGCSHCADCHVSDSVLLRWQREITNISLLCLSPLLFSLWLLACIFTSWRLSSSVSLGPPLSAFTLLQSFNNSGSLGRERCTAEGQLYHNACGAAVDVDCFITVVNSVRRC